MPPRCARSLSCPRLASRCEVPMPPPPQARENLTRGAGPPQEELKRSLPRARKKGAAWWAAPSGKNERSRKRRGRRSPQQRQHALRRGVGGGEDGGAGLREDLGAGHRGGFGGEVGVADAALAGRHVLHRHAQAVHVRLQRVLLERAETTAQDRDLLDRLLDDLAGLSRIAADERARATGHQVVEEAGGGVAELAGGDGADPDVDLLVAGDLGAELEQGAAARDRELARADAHRLVELDLEVEGG